ncbi:hypothetical protein [Paenibacillus senegalensis]|uniref:hypothetical protein n=1 Tax=Paenibacillus senegalensis TaxID=1465766 RepID=UPI00028A3EA4|nr:hypothetical protein [Paenibacillus senegalensis]
MPRQSEPLNEHSADDLISASQAAGSQSNAVEPAYPINEAARNISLYGNNTGTEGYNASLEADTAEHPALDANHAQASEQSEQPLQAADTRIHSEKLRYENADNIYE